MKFSKGTYYFVKEGIYPCSDEEYPEKNIKLVFGDIVTKDNNKTYISRIGINVYGITIHDNCVRLGDKDIDTINI